MELRLNEKGNALSALPGALSSRTLDLKGGAHPNQVLGSNWRNFSGRLRSVVDDIHRLSLLQKPEQSTVTESFRDLTYSATELFDSYSQFLVDRLGGLARADKGKLQDFRTMAKRLRSPWAVICNKFKHSGAQIALIRGMSPFTARFLLLAYKDGDSLIRDDDVHLGHSGGICLVKSTLEMVHGLLRVDFQATRFIASLEPQLPASEVRYVTLDVGESLPRLMGMSATVVPGEPSRFDGIELEGGLLRLARCTAERLPTTMQLTTALSGDGHTKTISFM